MLTIDKLRYHIGDRTLFDEASVRIHAGHKVGLVGPNGAGKSTLLRMILREQPPDGGEIRLRRGARVGTVSQEAPGGETTPIEFVLAADTERTELLAEADHATDPHRIAEIHGRLAEIDAAAAPARAATILAGLGFDEAAQGRPLESF
ncbi:MAG: ABC-F family ATP-binding cassette domain-containing protein, partial [Candidatus Eisenbacteria bacterium]|nr:ABC-F family ATP-binding cassette domain-containing protein [Candidatus Eisenbacteria bacterium]